MKLKDVIEQSLQLPENQRLATAAMIDMTVEANMRSVLAQLESMQKASDKQFESMKWLYITTISLCGFMVAGLGLFLKIYLG